MKLLSWAPVAILGSGCLLSMGVRPQLTMPLERPLAEVVPKRIGSEVATDLKVSDEERNIVAMTDYVLRTYASAGAAPKSPYKYSVYVSYYDKQTRGRTIHSPKNCLPGGGWEALSSTTAKVATTDGAVTVNKYLLHRRGQRAMVLYWYQGRGRVESNEYRVKANLLRDAALLRRSEEALVRIVVPVTSSEENAFKLAASIAAQMVTAVELALPA